MKAKSITKRVLSAVLCAVMLFSCWVFTAPQAEAADPGNYNVRVYFSQNGSVGSFTGNVGGTPSDKLGVIVRYKPNNGTGTSSNSTTKVCWNNNESGVSKEISGFPDLLYLCYDENRVAGSRYAHVTKMEVQGTGQSSWTTLWEGDLQVGSVMNPYGISVDMNGTIKNDWIDTDKECKAVNAGSGWADKFPYPTLNAPTYNDTLGVNAPDSATVTTAASFNSTDQYGVTLGGTFSVGYELTRHQYYINSWVDQTLPNDSISFDTSNGTITPLKANGYARHDNYVRATGTWSYKSGTTYTSSSQWVKMTYPSYTVTYNYNYNTTPSTWNVNTSNKTAEYIPYATATAAESSTNSALWGDLAPTPPTPDASHQYYYTNAGHYTNGSYSNPSTGIKADTPVTMSGYTTNSGHTWGNYAQFTGTQNGVFTPEDYHRATCTNYSQTHYKYQLHQWGTTSFTFADNGKTATAKRVCQTNGCKYEQSQSVTCTSAVKTPATCLENGWTTYTATSPFGDGATGTKDVQDIDASGHSWNPTTFTFSEDGTTATATRVCKNDKNHTETQNATMSHAQKTPPTCTEKGWNTYTATSPFAGDTASATKDVQDIPATSHDYGAWTDYDNATKHRRVCANDSNHIEYEDHNWSGWQNVAPTAEETGVKATVRQKLADAQYNEETSHYNYCTVCGYTKIESHPPVEQWTIDQEHTYPATCETAGQTTSKCPDCHKTKVTPVAATGHDRKQESVTPGDDSTGYECFRCTICGDYWAAIYDEGAQEYVPLTEDPETHEAISGASEASNVKGGSTPVPAPFFNSYATDPSEEGFDYDYSYRDSSLKLMKDAYVDTENTRQDFRFSGAVTIPEGVSYKVDPSKNVNEVDNVILDFGFVYTQDWYNQGENSGYGAAKLTLENVAKYSTGYAKMSVVENNHNDKIDNGAFNGSNWSGVTYHPKTAVRDVETLTFNLVISMKAKNWKKQYAARPYITYKYRGVVYTVYDGGASDQSVTYSFGSVYAIAAASISMYKDSASDVVLNYVTNRIINHRNDFGTDAATDWWRWFNEYETYEGNVNDPNSLYNWYLSELEAL